MYIRIESPLLTLWAVVRFENLQLMFSFQEANGADSKNDYAQQRILFDGYMRMEIFKHLRKEIYKMIPKDVITLVIDFMN